MILLISRNTSLKSGRISASEIEKRSPARDKSRLLNTFVNRSCILALFLFYTKILVFFSLTQNFLLHFSLRFVKLSLRFSVHSVLDYHFNFFVVDKSRIVYRLVLYIYDDDLISAFHNDLFKR